jgi:hypothetical protein
MPMANLWWGVLLYLQYAIQEYELDNDQSSKDLYDPQQLRATKQIRLCLENN